jgi:ubiquinone/menaquinone biosynthesis C-methylase UbiE
MAFVLGGGVCETAVIGRSIRFVDPDTHVELTEDGGFLLDPLTGGRIARIVHGVPRFVKAADNYAESFGWQWKRWVDNQSESRGSSVKQRQLVLERTHFSEYELQGKTILECGMGGGDDTEVLLTLPFKEIHSFDLSSAVDRARRYLHDDRLVLAQASIHAIPYPDETFDSVYCHRVLQHTPDPERSLRCICREVKPNGILFVHSYKRSPEHMSEWRYKYRPVTTRIPKVLVYWYVQYLGWAMHHVVALLYRSGGTSRRFAYRYVPFYRADRTGAIADMGTNEVVEFEKLITFDALTPKYDSPMSTSRLRAILTEEGFVIEHLEDRFASPVYATARKQTTAGPKGVR